MDEFRGGIQLPCRGKCLYNCLIELLSVNFKSCGFLHKLRHSEMLLSQLILQICDSFEAFT